MFFFTELSFSPVFLGQISSNDAFCKCGCLPWTWTNCEADWDLDFEPSENQWMAFGVRYLAWSHFLSWILKIDPWVLSPEIPVVASQWYLDCMKGTPWVMYQGFVHLQKDEQQNSIDYFCFWWIWRLKLKHDKVEYLFTSRLVSLDVSPRYIWIWLCRYIRCCSVCNISWISAGCR